MLTTPTAVQERPQAQPSVPDVNTDLSRGLSDAEVRARQAKYGFNEVPERKPNLWLMFAKKFWGLSAWMIELIMVLSFILHKYSDLYIVTALLVVNGVLSFAQEQRASAAVETLRRRLQVGARVLREGKWSVVPARELVPGDVVRVRAGDFVPADMSLVEGHLQVDQSALTGESLEVDKEKADVLYSGSVVRRGEATGVVTLTGAHTYFGRTTELVQLARPKLHMEEVISRVVKWLFVIVGVMLAITMVFVVIRGLPFLDILPLMLVLLLGAVPVALPVMFTVSMALGSLQLAKQGVLVTRLSASDDAASMDVLCVDKTGTITANRLNVVSILPLDGQSEDQVLLWGSLASQEANHDPIDMAFISEARRRELLDEDWVQRSFSPFDPSTRRTEAIVSRGEGEWRVAKGAVSVITQACQLDEQACRDLEERSAPLTKSGARLLAVAVGDAGGPLRLAGLVALSDTPRPDAPKLIRELKELGVSVKMLTGDALPIAREVARAVGLGSNVERLADLEKQAAVDAQAAAQAAEASDGFAEIYPEGKYTVVKELQARGHVVGMTGDGVNDAPALRQAEVGIAMSNATDVAKGAASVVLTEEGLGGIVDLVRNGRMIYQRIATWVINKMSRTIQKSAFVVIAFLITGRFVVSAFAMLLMMFMTDFVKISLSTDNMRGSRTPNNWDVLGLTKIGVLLGLLMTVESLGLLYLGFHWFHLGGDDQALSTFSYITLLYFALFSIFTVRVRRHFWESMPSKTLLIAIGLDLVISTVLALVGIPGLVALPAGVVAFVMVYSFIFSLVVNDFAKRLAVTRLGLNW